MERLALRTVVPTSAAILMLVGCQSEKPAQQAEWEQEYVDQLTQVEEDMYQSQAAIIKLFDGLIEEGHYVQSLIHVEEKQQRLEETMSAFIDRTTEDGVPEAYLELHIQLLYLKNKHEDILSVGEHHATEDDFLHYVEGFADSIEEYDLQLESYKDKAEEQNVSATLHSYDDLLKDEDYAIQDITEKMLGTQIDAYLSVFQEHANAFYKEEQLLKEDKQLIEESGFSELSDEEVEEMLETIDAQRTIVQAFLDLPYPNGAEPLHAFFIEESQEFLNLSILLYSSVEAQNELLAQDTILRIRQLEQDVDEKKVEMDQLIESVKQSVASDLEKI